MFAFVTLAGLLWSRYVTGLETAFTGDSNLREASRVRAPYLDTLSTPQHSLFNEAMEALDANFAPPFIVRSFKPKVLIPIHDLGGSSTHPGTLHGIQSDYWPGIKGMTQKWRLP